MSFYDWLFKIGFIGEDSWRDKVRKGSNKEVKDLKEIIKSIK